MDPLEFSNLGAVPSPYDYRKVPAGAIASTLPLPLIYSYPDINKFPVWNQRKIGSCVGHALAKAMQIYWYRHTGKIVNFSARWLYAVAKCLDDYEFEGTYPSLVAKIMKDYGCATEATCSNDSTLDHETYVYNRKLENIPQAAKDEAANYKIPGYAFVNTQDPSEVRRIIYENGAFAGLLKIGKE